MRPLKVMMTCGGTGGHIFPVIALSQQWPEAQFMFVLSNDRSDQRYVSGVPGDFRFISASNRRPIKMMIGFFQALLLFLRFRPDVVIGAGGYVTVPVLVVAALLRRSIVLLEQNSIPGRVTRFFSRISVLVCLSFPQSHSLLAPRCHWTLTGNPVRTQFPQGAYVERMEQILARLSGKKLVIVGGSQGARALNNWIIQHYDALIMAGYCIVHVLGDRDYQRYGYAHPQFETILDGKVMVCRFVEAMDLLYGWADVIVSRSGATTIAELLVFNKPSVLVPYPSSKDDHQRANAKFMSEQQKSVVVEESAFEETLLGDVLDDAMVQFSPSQYDNPAMAVKNKILSVITDV